MMRFLRPALALFLGATLLFGVLYPAALTLVAQLAFHDEATGSLILKDGTVVGSKLLAQDFQSERYFWGRAEAIGGAMIPGPSNQSATNGSLLDRLRYRKKILGMTDTVVPSDLVTGSASGTDPDITPEGATAQIPRIAKARQISEATLTNLVKDKTKGLQLGLFGEARVNVLALNIALDALPPEAAPAAAVVAPPKAEEPKAAKHHEAPKKEEARKAETPVLPEPVKTPELPALDLPKVDAATPKAEPANAETAKETPAKANPAKAEPAKTNPAKPKVPAPKGN